ncbi:hypothetical protein [Leifsonia xyli]|uniref:hypothetical protein n=1 Tax=Leifsonia xyli TaxID=1575 RepID=UPI003D67A332
MSTTDLTPDFTPEHSAAIRQLLIDTVADEPRRRRHLQILLTSLLSAVAVVLAGGTAALALTGVIHFGSGDTPPAPMPTPTQTVTPTPTPTPRPTATAAQISVQTSPIAPRDVVSLPAKPSWGLDVPGKGDPCGQRAFIDVADGLTLVQTGPAEVGDDGTGCDPVHQNVQLSLVDTIHGTVTWSRNWSWTKRAGAPAGGTVVQTTVLGSSGTILIVDQRVTGGPHDVLRLADGSTLGTFDATAPADGLLAPQAVQDGSGDILLAISDPSGHGSVERVDPMDAGHPLWSTPVPAPYVSAFISPGDTFGRARVAYTPSGGHPPPPHWTWRPDGSAPLWTTCSSWTGRTSASREPRTAPLRGRSAPTRIRRSGPGTCRPTRSCARWAPRRTCPGRRSGCTHRPATSS